MATGTRNPRVLQGRRYRTDFVPTGMLLCEILYPSGMVGTGVK